MDPGRLAGWFVANVDGLEPPLRIDELGPSAVRVEDGTGRAWVVRLGGHDAAREHRVLCALAPTAVPVPAAAGVCTDVSVLGTSFGVTAFVDGHVLRTRGDAEKRLDPAGRRVAGETLVDALAALHDVDVDAAGLGDLGPRSGYMAAQLDRWRRRVAGGQAAAGRCLLLVHDLADFLQARLPPDPAQPSIVHGDFRLDAAVVDDAGSVQAVLGWSGATLGDPLMDLGQLLAYWTDPGQDNEALGVAPTSVDGFPARRDIAARYAERSGTDLDRLELYVGFAYWKLACILEEVYGRERTARPSETNYLDGLSHQVLRLADSARETLGGP
ncbi:MAG: phosphotransferase family protein [Acidimicrobiales bacterium]